MNKSILRKTLECVLLGLIIYLVIPSNEENERINLIHKLLPKTVMIEVDAVVREVSLKMTKKGFEMESSTQTRTFLGSGVIVSRQGHVLTCNHLFTNGEVKQIRIISYFGTIHISSVIANRESHDLALLKMPPVPASFVAELDRINNQRVGQNLIAIGYPLGNEFTVTHGILSGLYNDNYGYNLIQSDVFINPGNSGGPLFNSEGKLVGINRLIVSAGFDPTFSGIGLSTSISQITEFLVKHKIVKFKR